MSLSHIDQDGRARMVDVSDKEISARVAVACGKIRLSQEAFAAVSEGGGPKGDVLSTAEIAGVMAAKRTSDLIPLCHPLVLDKVTVEAELDTDIPGVTVTASVKNRGRTGVEMEALTAVGVALLTVYDMTKAMGHEMEIFGIQLLEKSGGAGGNWKR
ncbi:MAG: cyclic pyranopterin monophosphate synthase MoaC [Gemmatimonadota bacterium]|nr:cyclic pyranopterin monophosphate synthase MoaC [Gemmatimonadota bacterium]